MILGACNPPLARKLLMVNKAIGVMLPCNISVFEENGGTAIVDDSTLQELFIDVGARSKRVLATIAD